MLWPNDHPHQDEQQLQPQQQQDTCVDSQFASQPDVYPSPPSSQQPPPSSSFIPSAQPVLRIPISPILEPITPCPSPSPPWSDTDESFTFITPPLSPLVGGSVQENVDNPASSTLNRAALDSPGAQNDVVSRTSTPAQDDSFDNSLLDAVVDGIANVSVSMDRDEAGRWRIKRPLNE